MLKKGALAFAGVATAIGCAVVPDQTLGTHSVLTTGDDSGILGDDGGFFGLDAGTFASPLQPTFGPVTVADRAPPPISGGTLLVTRDGTHAVAADPDRDAIYVVDLTKHAVSAAVTLFTGDEPGRVVEDGAGRVHVALRGGGALVSIDVAKGTVLGRRSVCPAPRGVAWDSAADVVWVACATGELVSLPAAGGSATQSLVVERDLRDVIVRDGSLAVSQFRSAQMLNVDATGKVTRRDQLPSPISTFSPHVVWRSVAGPSGTVVSVHQIESLQSIATHAMGGYGGGCGGFPGGAIFVGAGTEGGAGGGCMPTADGGAVSAPPDEGGAPDDAAGSASDGGDGGFFVQKVPLNPPPPPPGGAFGGCGPAVVDSVLTVLGPGGTTLVNVPFNGTLPVDVAVSNDGSRIAAVAPGNAFAQTPVIDTLFLFDPCGSTIASAAVPSGKNMSVQLTAVAFASNGDVVVQSREPAFIAILDNTTGLVKNTVTLTTGSRADTGHDVFHTQAGALIACASCHPEGRDDGHIWTLDGQSRRTPSLRGTIAGTAPYHWPGDEKTLDVLVNDVYTVRMGGVTLDTEPRNALTGWVQKVPALPAPAWVDPAAAGRGKTLFERTDVGCSGCHSGAKFTNNTTVDVGTGGSFQVPPLVGVGWRTPLFHDGCATTLADRFGACSTSKHGSIGGLSSGDVSDLIAYLETL